MHVILKPEMRIRIEKLEPFLAEEGFSIISRYSITDWIDFAGKLYNQQHKESELFRKKMDSYMFCANYLFGNNAVAFLLSRDSTIIGNLKILREIKKRFRQENSHKDLTEFLGEIESLGLVRISEIESTILSRLDLDTFRYLHCPDPQIEMYLREREILQSELTKQNLINEYQWEEMKQAKSFKNGRRDRSKVSS